jgi:hypothetical protein
VPVLGRDADEPGHPDGAAFQRVGAYRAAERSARSARRGVHGKCAGNFHRA